MSFIYQMYNNHSQMSSCFANGAGNILHCFHFSLLYGRLTNFLRDSRTDHSPVSCSNQGKNAGGVFIDMMDSEKRIEIKKWQPLSGCHCFVTLL